MKRYVDAGGPDRAVPHYAQVQVLTDDVADSIT